MTVSLNDPPDEFLIKEVSQGCRKSFEAIYERYKVPVFNYLRYLLRDHQASEDCMHEAFIQLYKKASLYKKKGPFKLWFFTMVRNLGFDHLRKRKRRFAMSLDQGVDERSGASYSQYSKLQEDVSQEGISPDEIVSKKENVQMIQEGIAKLNSGDRELIHLCDILGMAHKDVAAIIKRRSQTVTVGLYRARRRLARILGLKEDYLD